MFYILKSSILALFLSRARLYSLASLVSGLYPPCLCKATVSLTLGVSCRLKAQKHRTFRLSQKNRTSNPMLYVFCAYLKLKCSKGGFVIFADGTVKWCDALRDDKNPRGTLKRYGESMSTFDVGQAIRGGSKNILKSTE